MKPCTRTDGKQIHCTMYNHGFCMTEDKLYKECKLPESDCSTCQKGLNCERAQWPKHPCGDYDEI